jgi:arylsulfatase A-like enzyme
MGWLDRFRAWVWRTERASNELEYGALDAVHRAEDRVDEATHGRFYDAVEKADEEAGELLDRLGLDEDDERGESKPDDASTPPPPPR